MEEKNKIERKRKFDHRSQKLVGSRRCKTSPKQRAATVHAAPYLNNGTHATHSNFSPWGCLLLKRAIFVFKTYTPG